MTVYNDPIRGGDDHVNEAAPQENDEDEDQELVWTRPAINNMQENEDDSSSEDDDDEEIEAPEGYKPLAQDAPAGCGNGNEPSEEEEEEFDAQKEKDAIAAALAAMPASEALTELAAEAARQREREEREELAKVWTSPRPEITLDGGQLESIRLAMAKVALPEAAIPPWAKNMSDDEWKSMLAKKLNK